MDKYLYFGEKVAGYPTRMINEREARASAGLMFLFAYTGFMFVALRKGDFVTDLFAFTFFTEFIIRVFINPKYAPYMILARVFIGNQKPEYVGAPQKKFAWAIGVLLATSMLYFVLMNKGGHIRLSICYACLIFLYFESVLGICLGCSLYQLITRQKAENCPGGVCEIRTKDKIQKISWAQLTFLGIVLAALLVAFPYVKNKQYVFHIDNSDNFAAAMSAFQDLK
jgi:uncharacterized membrane protein